MRVISTRNAPKNRSPRTLLATSGALVAVAIAVTGCGGGIPSNSVAKVGSELITKKEFNHWLNAAARGQAQQTGSTAAVSIPDPPDFKKCIAGKQKTPVPKGTPKPKEADLKKQCQQEYDALKTQVMQFLISAEWIQQEADKRGIKVSDKDVRTEFTNQKKQSFPKEADYQKFLKSSGQTEADLLFRVKLDVLSNKVREKVVAGKDKVSDAEVQAYYNKNKSRFAQPETRDLNVVLTEKQPDAKKALAELKSGKSFKVVSKKYSIDQASKSQGGKLPAVAKGQQEKALDDAVFSAQKGKIVGPVKTQFGYYVFQVTKITKATQQSLADSKASIQAQLKSEKQQKALDAFVKDFQKTYTSKTDCAGDYKVQQCKNGKKAATTTAGPGGASSGGTSTAPQGSSTTPGQPQTAPQTPQTTTAPTTTP
jgi:foldase protein PrsA